MSGKVVESNQLLVTDLTTNEYAFTAAPNRYSSLELYSMQVHTAPECELALNSFSKMQEFIKVLESNCSYKAEYFNASFQCRFNK
ncbi:hypothetical protein GCM10008027_41350 [Pseudoalteromonas gelatinilytica]|uniref:Uncharacterized protein n=1 Tax=Pseudoalteromonas gelatinilytica TaxID=1703256 RepID=A0ABQ1U9Y2_9GAMM|nr:hypothetical protein GCM10008027_41350 [Pseudoalteromonas profundi]